MRITTQALEMREKIIQFLSTQETTVDMAAIKAHLGLEEFRFNGHLDKALKTKKILVENSWPFIVFDGEKPLYRCAHPVRKFSVTDKVKQIYLKNKEKSL